jgi:hypothetical protein
MMSLSIYTIIGYLGAGLFILSYFLLSNGKLKADQSVYQIMNVLGALCLIVNALKISDFPTLLVNGVWFMIGLVAYIRIVHQRKSQMEDR